MRRGNLGGHKAVGSGVFERRIHCGPGYRICFGRDGENLVVLVGGGSKARQSNDVNAAQQTWAEYKASKTKE